MKLSVIMPVYNECNTLRIIVDKVLATPYEKELIIIDDCSEDGTRDVLDEIAAEHPDTVRVFKHEVNQGKGAALRTGFAHTTGDVVLIQDADLEYTPDDYPTLLKPVSYTHLTLPTIHSV